jgi:hypothetical protein
MGSWAEGYRNGQSTARPSTFPFPKKISREILILGGASYSIIFLK